MLGMFSDWYSRQERRAAGLLALVITALIVFNVVTRALNQAVFWVDEVAVFLMVWMLFLAMAVLLKERRAVAVTVLVDQLPPGIRRMVGMLIDWVVLCFAVALLVICWRWYQPLDLIRAGFDLDRFSAETTNFIYQDVATTLPLPRFWVWLIIPYFGCSVLLHTVANIVSDPLGRHMDRGAGVPAGEGGAS